MCLAQRVLLLIAEHQRGGDARKRLFKLKWLAGALEKYSSRRQGLLRRGGHTGQAKGGNNHRASGNLHESS
jgi:hypothetical protein